MINVDHVHKVYPTRAGDRLILNDVTFSIAPGEKLGILGRNGAGKSTLVRLVSGAESPTLGTVTRTMSVSWPLAFGGAFQNALTGLDNVRFISRIYNQDYHKNIDFVSDFTELGLYLREPVRSYSQGMRARLAFAISMIIEFDCYLIDEITAVGDMKFHEKCAVELFEKRKDRAMLIISHDTEYVKNHCDHFAVLNDGKLVMYPDFSAAFEAHTVNLHLDVQ
ncbi:MAG: ATP-binding protein [Sphingomonas sanxanigenens]|uniref:ATP-binding protein n=1 Tax=Sphingomonas sanxanigenens TaxID=397260 RepID=A0A2W5C5D7_9SPHN|nr:MAG: ATP-binding protein [Sphingomonas sanxanigenens]